MTVSNAFSRPDQLSSRLRKRILSTAAELGYAGPDPSARSLVWGRTGTVGVLRSESPQYAFHDEHSAIWLSSLYEELGRNGLALTLLPTSPSESFVPARDVAMDGAIVHSARPAAAGVGWLRRRGLPLVYVDQAGDPEHPSVNLDDRGGAEQAARHLVDLGHRRIGLIPLGRDDSTSDDWYVARQRLAGWFDVLHQLTTTPCIEGAPASTLEAGMRAAARLLDREDRPTAILCFSDAIAAGVVQETIDRGLSVPGDISVVGFDDTPLATRIRPALTSVHQDIEGKGRAAATALVHAIARRRDGVDDNGEPPHHLLLPTTLRVRDSTGAPRH